MATITDNDLKMFQERARTELASGCDIGSIAWDSVIWDLCNEVRRLRSVSKERSDCAKLREALKAAKQYLDGHTVNILELRRKVDAALAAPARNCDVGTAREQLERFGKFCHANINMEGCGGNCPAFRTTRNDCELVWAQMPYEEGGAK